MAFSPPPSSSHNESDRVCESHLSPHLEVEYAKEQAAYWQDNASRVRKALKLSDQALAECKRSLAESQSAVAILQREKEQLLKDKEALQARICELEQKSSSSSGKEEEKTSKLEDCLDGVWQFETTLGWENYDKYQQDVLTLNCQNIATSPDVYLEIARGRSVQQVKVCLLPGKMYEENMATGEIRNVRKVKSERPDTSYPSYWRLEAPDKHAYAHDIPRDDPLFIEIANKFYETCHDNFQIFNIQYVQAAEQWESYVAKRARWFDRLKHNLNEKMLWHGTSLDNLEKIANQGFLRQFSHRAAYGDGVYFARDSGYSANSSYASPCSDGFQRVFYSRVLVGEYERGCSGMKIPNTKPHNPKCVFESTVDRVDSPGMYIIYQDDQAYPEFIITFKKGVRPPQPTLSYPQPPPGTRGVFSQPNYDNNALAIVPRAPASAITQQFSQPGLNGFTFRPNTQSSGFSFGPSTQPQQVSQSSGFVFGQSTSTQSSSVQQGGSNAASNQNSSVTGTFGLGWK